MGNRNKSFDSPEGLPEELEEVYEHLCKEIYWARHTMSIFELLYMTEKSRVKLLNRVAPKFFGWLQGILGEQMCIIVSRLTDPAGMGPYETVSLEQLHESCKEVFAKGYSLPDGRVYLEELEDKKDEVEDAAESIRYTRNKHVAHTDKAVWTANEEVESLPFSLQEVKDTLDGAEDYLKFLYVGATRNARSNVWQDLGGDVEKLVETLRLGDSK